MVIRSSVMERGRVGLGADTGFESEVRTEGGFKPFKNTSRDIAH